jgi:DNA modification methylase
MTSTAEVRLHWSGRTAPVPPPAAELRLFRAGQPSTMLVHGENLAAMGALRCRIRDGFALAYLDPPFFTGKKHAAVIRRRADSGEITRHERPAFDDRWGSFSEYLSALGDRIAAARELLRPDGCLVLHVDPKTSHYAKVLCDEVFGPGSFKSEIVWHYRRWPARTKNFQRMHDVLLRYVKDPNQTPRFRQLYEPLAASTLATWGDRKQRAVLDEAGRRRRSSTTAEPTPGTPLGDVWEIGIVAPVARERTGYPTQKPEALLRRLIEACTEPFDCVLDPYLGSGTTLAVCRQLGRQAVGIDVSLAAIQIVRKRLQGLGVQALEERVVTAGAPGLTGARSRRTPVREVA